MLYSVFIPCILESSNWALIIWIHIFLGRPWGRSQGFKLSNKADLAGAPSGSLHKCLNQLILLHLIFSDHFLHFDKDYTSSFVILSYHLMLSILLLNWRLNFAHMVITTLYNGVYTFCLWVRIQFYQDSASTCFCTSTHGLKQGTVHTGKWAIIAIFFWFSWNVKSWIPRYLCSIFEDP